MNEPSIPVSVLMEKRAVQSRWATHEWHVAAVVDPDLAGVPAGMFKHDGLVITLFRDEAEGYYLNTSTGAAQVFVMWRLGEGDESDVATPKFVTVSYNEAARLMDAQERVDMVPMPPAMHDWLVAYVDANYKPEPKKRRQKASFVAPANRAKL